MTQTILLVDDDADVRMTLRQILVDEGFVVHTAADGQHALRLLDKLAPPDLILLDYKMPVMNGKQFLDVMRQDMQLRDIPVVILSAWTREWSGARLEVAEVLMKPVDLELLVSTVRALCGNGALRKRES